MVAPLSLCMHGVTVRGRVLYILGVDVLAPCLYVEHCIHNPLSPKTQNLRSYYYCLFLFCFFAGCMMWNLGQCSNLKQYLFHSIVHWDTFFHEYLTIVCCVKWILQIIVAMWFCPRIHWCHHAFNQWFYIVMVIVSRSWWRTQSRWRHISLPVYNPLDLALTSLMIINFCVIVSG